jgi:molecular chaperone GrpE
MTEEKKVRIAVTRRQNKDEPETMPEEAPQPFERVQEKTQNAAEDELEAIRQEAAEYKDKYLRAAAELENTKKRVERRYADQTKQEKKRLLRAFLAVADNLERALDHPSGDGLRDGLKLTHQELKRLLSQEGVEPLETLGQPFDPYYHEAVSTMPGDDAEETVVGERQKGYLYRGELLRPARVEVAIPAPKKG